MVTGIMAMIMVVFLRMIVTMTTLIPWVAEERIKGQTPLVFPLYISRSDPSRRP